MRILLLKNGGWREIERAVCYPSPRCAEQATRAVALHSAARLAAQEGSILPPAPTPTDVKPGSITCDECPYPYPSKYLDIRVYSQDVRIAYMDVAPQGAANGHTVVLLHGNNFGGFYFKPIIDAPHEGGLPRHRP